MLPLISLSDVVDECRALLPDLIKFAYIPHNEFRINADPQGQSSSPPLKRSGSPDFSAFATSRSILEEDEHVLILEFAENSRGKKSQHPG
jgi:DEAD/DEAH box helicase domain-containing protein